MTMAFVLAMLAAQDKETPLALPLKGLTARCCEAPVREALAAIPHVKKVTLRKGGANYIADIVMEAGYGLPMSEIEKALAVAQEEMGDAMGTKYLVDEGLPSTAVHFYKTKGTADEAKLKKLDGFKSFKKGEGGFSALFDGAKVPTAAQVKKACGTEVTDLILSASKDGSRYACPKHADSVSPLPGKCPVCDIEMEKQTASKSTTTTQPSTATEEPKDGKKKGG